MSVALPNLLGDLDSSTEDALRASIQRFGVLVPVVRDQHGRTLDGHHRSRIADDLGVDYRADVVTVADDDEARQIAAELNTARRQMTAEQRREVVRLLREAGHSQRAVAGAIGVSQGTVQKDEAELTTSSHLSIPDRTTGTDGKSYPARRPPEPAPATTDDEQRIVEDAEYKYGHEGDRRHEPGDEQPGGDVHHMAVHYSSQTDDWSTPEDFYALIRQEFAPTLDVCALSSSAKCERYFTPDDDGLAQDWAGVCWMNPPYGRGIAEWVAKAARAAQDGATVVALVPARVDTAWWWSHCRHHEIRFLPGRLRFGDAETGAPFPSALVVFGRSANVVWWDHRNLPSLEVAA